MGFYIEDYRDSVKLAELHRSNGEKVVQARGAYDVAVHPGHLDFLRRAKDLGTILIVNVNNNDWVNRWKGEGRPILTAEERAVQVAEQEMVDYVFVHPATDIHPGIALAILSKPDVIVREGKDPLIIEEERQILEERAKGYKPSIHILPRSSYEGSTTDLIDRIRKPHEPAKGPFGLGSRIFTWSV